VPNDRLGHCEGRTTDPQLQAASLQIPSGLIQVKPVLQTVVWPSHLEPTQPLQTLSVVQRPLTHEDGFWQGEDALQDHPLQLQNASVCSRLTRNTMPEDLPPVACGAAANSVWSKASKAIITDCGFSITRCAQAADTGSRSLGGRLRRGTGRRSGRLCTRCCARNSPRSTRCSVLGVDPSRELPLHGLDDLLLVAIRVAVEVRESINHDVDGTRSLGLRGLSACYSNDLLATVRLTWTYWSSKESPMYMSIVLPVEGSVTLASRPQYFCVCCFQAVGLLL